MKLVRFKAEYSDSNPRLSYELVDETPIVWFDFFSKKRIEHYHVKLLGLVPTYKMEEADENDRPAIEAFVKLTNL